MQSDNKSKLFRLKLGVGVIFLVLAVVSFLAATGVNELQVEQTPSGKITVEFKDADVQDVFRVLALKGNVSIVADPEVKGLITVHITDVPWETVLDTICKTYGYAYEREGNIIRVTTLEKQGLDSLVTEVFTLNYAKAKDVSEAVTEMKSDRGKIKYDERANLVIVTDIPTNIYKIGKVISRLDSMTPQVTIEARIIETTLSNDENLGLKWNMAATATGSTRPTTFPWEAEKSYGPELGSFLPRGDKLGDFPAISQPAFKLATKDDFTFGVLDASSFSLLMQALSTRSSTKILSNPRVTTMDNQSAKIHVGTDWPIAKYSYNEESDRFVITGWEYKSYGILLEVTPTINKDGYITLKVHPEISERQDVVNFQGAEVPVLATQTTDCKVMIKDGETLVVGGLLKDKTISTKTKVPLLGDIPLLGALFTHKSDIIEKRDLLIFITPHLVSREKLAQRRELSQAALERAKAVPLQIEEDISIEDVISPEIQELIKKEAAPVTSKEEPKSGQPDTAATIKVEEKKTVVPVEESKKQEEQNKGFIFKK